MRIPKEIKGKNKIRNLYICSLYIKGKNTAEIVAVLRERNINLSIRRIEQILNENEAFVNARIGWTKTKRIHKMQRIAERMPEKTRLDIVDVLEKLSKLIDGSQTNINTQVNVNQSVQNNLEIKDDEREFADTMRKYLEHNKN